MENQNHKINENTYFDSYDLPGRDKLGSVNKRESPLADHFKELVDLLDGLVFVFLFIISVIKIQEVVLRKI
jgi:hypothetical protein